jgi:hypothetical protein
MSMRKFRLAAVICALSLSGVAWAQSLPGYYPDEGFRRTGRIDSVQGAVQRIVIDDLAYTISSNLIVHSTKAYSVPISSLEIGTHVGFKLLNSRGRIITEIWLLPDGYRDGPRQRR